MLLLQLPHLTCHSSMAALRGQLALVLKTSGAHLKLAKRLKLAKLESFVIIWV